MTLKETYNIQKPIAQTGTGIILAQYQKSTNSVSNFQSGSQLTEFLINELQAIGYSFLDIKDYIQLEANLKTQIEALNNVQFNASEWNRFKLDYLAAPNDTMVDRCKKIQQDNIKDFVFDDGITKNILIFDKRNIPNNKVQVISSLRLDGIHSQPYHLTVLVNGLPLVQIGLNHRTDDLKNLFDDIISYQNRFGGFMNALYQYVQIFVISNGQQTKYFANPLNSGNKNYDFAALWADSLNNEISELVDFVKYFFHKNILLTLISRYMVLNKDNVLLVMRPYQIAATEKILNQINYWNQNKAFSEKASNSGGGYVWHTTGSGKTLTSFKCATLASQLPGIDKVFFVVDRKDLDNQTITEFNKFQKDCVDWMDNTRILTKYIEDENRKIIVTTIQKFHRFINRNPNHPIYQTKCVFIFDECHRSQFGDFQKSFQRFKKHIRFGFTGTPIFKENAPQSDLTTGVVFGGDKPLHSYVITDAIKDNKVLKFKVDYQQTNHDFVDNENEQDLQKIKSDLMLAHPNRIKTIAEHILKVFDQKTHRNSLLKLEQKRKIGFNAMLATDSIHTAKLYYQTFKDLQAHLPLEERLRIGLIYSCPVTPDFENPTKASINIFNFDKLETVEEESFEPDNIADQDSRDFLANAIDDYNVMFNSNYSIHHDSFPNYYKDLSKKVQDNEIDLLIVVNMFLTGFDAKTLNTLFVDKNLRYHGLIQAFSRTNRIYNTEKSVGNIVCYRNLEAATHEALKLYADEKSANIVLERNYTDYLQGYFDEKLDKKVTGYMDVCQQLIDNFPEPTEISEPDKQTEFVDLVGSYLKLNNSLKNFDEAETLKNILPEDYLQEMKSAYFAINDQFQKVAEKSANEIFNNDNYQKATFYLDLLKTDDITYDFIIKEILRKFQESGDTKENRDQIRKTILANFQTRNKEALIMNFIDHCDFEQIHNSQEILDAFHKYAKEQYYQSVDHLITNQNLKPDLTKKYVEYSLARGYASPIGTDFSAILPNISRRGGQREKKSAEVFAKIQKIIQEYVGLFSFE